MIDLKINIDQLKNYLGTGLELTYGTKDQFKSILGRPGLTGNMDIHSVIDIEAKPICYRLSDLDKFIPELGFVPLERLCEFTTTEINGNGEIESAEYDGDCHVTQMPDSMDWYRMQLLFQWNFWPFGDEYFNEGLVIDKLKKDE